ncbi:unnamed protein product [Prunus armeniaca]|uniref:Uncharacterized protein n=1 Tax=Prunus armeniaca TaxID=36596 RepID=A0A6J5V9X3_PRUAR|nr:unnamed protein product [Prunus armeniaca]
MAKLTSAELPFEELSWQNSLSRTPFGGTYLSRNSLPRNYLPLAELTFRETPFCRTSSVGHPSAELPLRNSLGKTPFCGTYLSETSFRELEIQRI